MGLGQNRPRRVAAATVLSAALLLTTAPTARAQEATTVVRVDAGSVLGPVNTALTGVGWHPGGPPLAAVEELGPRVVRLDASLQDVSPGPGTLRLDRLLADVAEVRSIGAEPLVILAYMPAWLGAPTASGRDPTRVAPRDLDAWQQVVHDVVVALATAPSPARRFEAWNEPDIPIFWQDTPEAWAATVTRTARAIAAVEAETGHDLAFGGPATAVPDPVYLATFLRPLRDPALPLDFVSWHYYGNSPFLGPDGNEFPATEPLDPVIGRQNPLASPAAYGPQVAMMRTWTAAALAGTPRPVPAMILDEWNLSPGGFDRRHDSHEGAAFAAGVLIEMQRAGLEESAFFKVADSAPPAGEPRYGGHGLVAHDGGRKPVWWALWLWGRQARQRVAVEAGAGDLWGQAAVDDRRLTLLLASFSASRPAPRTVDVEITGLPWTASAAHVRRVDAEHPAASTADALAVDGNRIRFSLPAQAVAFVELTAAPATAPGGAPAAAAPATSPAAGHELPATGEQGRAGLLGLLLTALAWTGARHTRRRSRRAPLA